MTALETYPDAASLAQAGAEHFVTVAEGAIAARGRFVTALSGGSTPRGLYARIAGDELAAQVDWARVHLFWGDERCVPPDHAASNYLLACETLIEHVPIPEENVHRIRGELEPEEAASDYEHALRTFFRPPADENQKPIPRFDLILLGMGNDGHTASLFPGSVALHERTRWVAAYYVDKLHAWRITLTPFVINAATYVTFLVSGASKAQGLQQVLTGPHQPDLLPAQIVNPDDGHLLWLVDEQAAALLQGGSDR